MLQYVGAGQTGIKPGAKYEVSTKIAHKGFLISIIQENAKSKVKYLQSTPS